MTLFLSMALSSLFSRNEHHTDRMLRIALGCGGVALAVAGPQTPWGWLGLIPLVTGLGGWCPLYRLFGVRTCKTS